VKAVLPVHLRGDVCDLPGLKSLADGIGAVLVEDAPHALGSVGTFDGAVHPVGDGAYSAFASFSFHPVKTLATGEGGMLTTNDAALAARARSLRGHGMVRPAGRRALGLRDAGAGLQLPHPRRALRPGDLAAVQAGPLRGPATDAGGALCREAGGSGPDRAPGGQPRLVDPALHLLTVLIDFEAAGTTRLVVVEA
jgi:hypothetical protein